MGLVLIVCSRISGFEGLRECKSFWNSGINWAMNVCSVRVNIVLRKKENKLLFP